MPTLPSQRSFALSLDAIIEPETNWFAAPANHFWYWRLDRALSPPPLTLGEEFLSEPVSVPVPTSRSEMSRYVRVLEMMPDGMYGWRGDWLASFPEHTDLAEADLAAWKEWLTDEAVNKFLDTAIQRCQRAADANTQARGYVVCGYK